MEFLMGDSLNVSFPSENLPAHGCSGRCPFLRNINVPTKFSFSAPITIFEPGTKGPIFEDEHNFETAFKLFHGKDGVIPLPGTGRSFVHKITGEPEPKSPQFNPLAAKTASISLSVFGPGGPFNFDFFSNKWKGQKKKSSWKNTSSQGGVKSSHEALSNDWLERGQCLIAKSYRTVKQVLPLVAKALQPPSSIKLRCPLAVVAARAALARTALVRTLRPQPLPAKMVFIALLGMAANIPLGVWRAHTEKFSLQWFAAVHVAVPFIAMLRKSVVMPKTAMALTIAASILGQTIGSRAERYRLKALVVGNSFSSSRENIVDIQKNGKCTKEAAWELEAATRSSSSAPAGVCC